MGAVFQAWDIRTKRPCAVKILHPDSCDDDMATKRFSDEAQLVSRLCHPNIVEIWDYGRDDAGGQYLTMELLHGQNLYSFLQQHGPLPGDVALGLVKQVGSALHAVHLTGIVHRDLKPQNIILIPVPGTTEGMQAKVIDFGLAKVADRRQAPPRGSDGMLIGTAQYLAPEAWRGISAEVDARADQWALAVILYRMLSGRLPYDAEENTVALGMLIHHETHTPLRELVPQVPPHVEDAIDRALQKDKRLRFASVLHFVHALHQLPFSEECGVAISERSTERVQRCDPDAGQESYHELICVESEADSESWKRPWSQSEVAPALRVPECLEWESGPCNPQLPSQLDSQSVATVESPALLQAASKRRSLESPGWLSFVLPLCSLVGAVAAWSRPAVDAQATRREELPQRSVRIDFPPAARLGYDCVTCQGALSSSVTVGQARGTNTTSPESSPQGVNGQETLPASTKRPVQQSQNSQSRMGHNMRGRVTPAL